MTRQKFRRKLKKIITFTKRGSHGVFAIRTPILTIDLHKKYPWDKAFSFHETRTKAKELRLPIGEYSLEFTTSGKTYLQLVDGPDYLTNTDWILDEFDSSFNDLAIASLKYHLDYSICNNEDQRDNYEDIIKRLSEDSPEVCETPEQHAIYNSVYNDETVEDFFSTINEPTPPAIKEIYDDYHRREKEYHERQLQARIDFIKIMPYLWS